MYHWEKRIRELFASILLQYQAQQIDSLVLFNLVFRCSLFLFRLYLMPFCVSSFSSLIKDRGFFVFISPIPQETILAIIFCAVFLLFVGAIKLTNRAISQEKS